MWLSPGLAAVQNRNERVTEINHKNTTAIILLLLLLLYSYASGVWLDKTGTTACESTRVRCTWRRAGKTGTTA
eukprot:5110575-Heterocapsa_arctica.AAC.1